MKHKKLLIGLVAAAVAGCVSAPPPRIVDGNYVNARYGFAVHVPEQWTPTGQVPDRFLPNNSLGFDPFAGAAPSQRSMRRNTFAHVPQETSYNWVLGLYSDVAFVNDTGTGVIAIDINKTSADLGNKSIEEVQHIMKAALAHEQRIVNSRICAIYGLQFGVTPECVTDAPSLVARRWFYQRKTDGKMRCENRVYAFTVNENDTCIVDLTLISEENAFEENLGAFNRMLRTLTRVPPDLAPDTK